VLQEELHQKNLLNNAEPAVQDLSVEYFRLQSVQEGWTQSLSKNYKKKYNFNSELIQIFPATTNRYEVLSNLQEDESVSVTTKDTKTQNLNNCPQAKGNIQLVRSVGKSEHKVLIFGDSHAKKCALELCHKLDHKYEVHGFIKRGCVTSEIIRTAEKEISSLKREDVVILWAGANDISINKSKEALKNLSYFMNANQKVNIISINALPRHDLMPTSCVNIEAVN
jgi:hypothetical protein